MALRWLKKFFRPVDGRSSTSLTVVKRPVVPGARRDVGALEET